MAKKSVSSKALSKRVCSICAAAAQTVASATSNTPTSTARCISLMARVCDQVAELAIALNAYLALERFVLPVYADENQASVQASRIELAAMLRAFNAKVLQHVDALALATSVLQAEMSGDEGLAR
ncbi:hypothetical protein [Hydrogenophaga sp.]|uniref:hypothetical protein n=1 Tax=Hydrogenophaga sp. TaxID=1904254 RepID=UPI002717933E|nr:hypothetical protein [Hydrogenophaga sp.]MDO9434074.1 hypothetical protein [Hydrogenophaga sp.]